MLGTDVILTKDTPFRSKEDLFLRNSEKTRVVFSRFQTLLSSRGCATTLLIVQTVVTSSKDVNTGLVGRTYGIALLSRQQKRQTQIV